MAPLKEITIKNNTENWFDNEIPEAVSIRKIFQKN